MLGLGGSGGPSLLGLGFRLWGVGFRVGSDLRLGRRVLGLKLWGLGFREQAEHNRVPL